MNALILSQIGGKEKSHYCYCFRIWWLQFSRRLYIKLLQEKKIQICFLAERILSKESHLVWWPLTLATANPMSISSSFPDHSTNGGDFLVLGTEAVTIRAPREETRVLYANYSNFFPLGKWLDLKCSAWGF